MVDGPEGMDDLYDALKFSLEQEGLQILEERTVTTEVDGRRLKFSDLREN